MASLEFLQKVIGGRIYKLKPRSGNYQQTYEWHLNGPLAISTCKQLAPYTFAKRKQLELAAEWPRIGTGNVSGISAEASLKRQEIDQQLRQLKQTPHPTVSSVPHDAYFAGFFDAEGCISVRKNAMWVRIGQKYRAVLDAHAQRFGGGTVYTCKNGGYAYGASGSTARAFMAAVMPYSREKLPQWRLIQNMGDDPETSVKLGLLKGQRKM